MKPDDGTRLDSIIKRAIPLILFSYDINKKPFIEKVGHLYGSFIANDSTTFEELFIQITDMINNREILDSNRERLIESFSNRTKTYDERLREYDEIIKILKKSLGKIDTNRKYILELQKEMNEIKSQKKLKEKKDEILTGEKPKFSTKNKCPICGTTLISKSKNRYGYKLFRCSSKTECGKYFVLDMNGEFFRCDDCKEVLVGMGKELKCMCCGKKLKVIE